ncbi:MAG: lytic transglycosylase domain-containing protein [Sulfuricaulis sp.]|nr:lytic transglycosylase domain-containing protein [Sulfuricaulis sp.]
MSFTAFGPIYKATAALLPLAMDSPQAKAMLMAIAMQESRFDERRQIGGPARGFWQFEFGGIRGVLNHKQSQPLIRSVLDRLDYDHKPDTSYAAIEHNDVLAFAYARCLLWTLPDPLPAQHETEEGWRQYADAWRPGRPHRATWNAFFTQAWKMVT